MKIQMQTLYAGPKGIRKVNSIHDVPNEEAAELVDGHFATLVNVNDRATLDKLTAKKSAPEKK